MHLKKTSPLPLQGLKLKDREDIIKWLVNKEDRSEPCKSVIPEKLKVRDNLETTPAFIAAFSFDVGKFLQSCMP